MFSEFLFDECIKSRLIKDKIFFTENKKKLDQMYPFERYYTHYIYVHNAPRKTIPLINYSTDLMDFIRSLIDL